MKTDPKRVDFDPFPWDSFAVWILTQMKRWGQIKGDVDYRAVAEQVFLATDTAELMKEMGLSAAVERLQVIYRHGQDLRSVEARGIPQELQDQESRMMIAAGKRDGSASGHLDDQAGKLPAAWRR